MDRDLKGGALDREVERLRDEEHCGGYEPSEEDTGDDAGMIEDLKAADNYKLCSMTMTVDQMKTLQSCAQYVVSTDTADWTDIADLITLMGRLDQAVDVAIPTVYVNVYEQEQVYGGPEEGGWWYWTKKCIVTIPSCDINEALDVIPTLIEEYFNDSDEADYDHDWHAEWEGCAELPIDRYLIVPQATGQFSIEVEWAPAASEDMTVKTYE